MSGIIGAIAGGRASLQKNNLGVRTYFLLACYAALVLFLFALAFFKPNPTVSLTNPVFPAVMPEHLPKHTIQYLGGFIPLDKSGSVIPRRDDRCRRLKPVDSGGESWNIIENSTGSGSGFIIAFVSAKNVTPPAFGENCSIFAKKTWTNSSPLAVSAAVCGGNPCKAGYAFKTIGVSACAAYLERGDFSRCFTCEKVN